MPTHRNSRYPYHLARLVAARLQKLQLESPSEEVLLRLFETLYFASLNTDEGQQCLCTVNFVEPISDGEPVPGTTANHWQAVQFDQALPLTVPALVKVAKAADPQVASLAVCVNTQGELTIWGIVDQEFRYSDYVALDSATRLGRPGLFQASIKGVGNISVSKDAHLLGSLEQDTLVDEYHDVLWSGPVHERLRENCLAAVGKMQWSESEAIASQLFLEEMCVRWGNSICRMLLNIQEYRHGGGLLIVPSWPAVEMHAKHELTYGRLPKALVAMVRHQFLKRWTGERIDEHCRRRRDSVPCGYHFDSVEYQRLLDEHKNEVLGCARFIASLSRPDGFVALDQGLVAHAFGVEARADSELEEIFLAGDALATPATLRSAVVSQYGTRHRAMMRYCDKHHGALGFIVSQDGDIRATMNVNGRLILWENINLHLAFRSESSMASNSEETGEAMQAAIGRDMPAGAA